MITIRIDVDYAYPSRLKSCLAMKGFWWGEDAQYLQYAKQLAQIINQSEQHVKAYWFFNPYTFPDADMIKLLDNDRHEIGLHVINNPNEELVLLESLLKKKIHYYTIHGTSRLIGQIVWHRKLGQKQAIIPEDFRLKSFHDYSTQCLDAVCYLLSVDEATEAFKNWLSEDYVLECHPEWLSRRGTFNHRGPYIDVLKNLLTS